MGLILNNISFSGGMVLSAIPPAQLTGVTYTVSSTLSGNSPPTYQFMNDNNANGASNGNQWGSDNLLNPEFIRADVGSTKTLTQIIIGYDYLNNLPGGWGVSYTAGLTVGVSTDGTNYTTITTTPTYASTGSTNGLVTISLGSVSARYVRLSKPSAYICTLEFQVWGY
jgi:hypothetical protein